MAEGLKPFLAALSTRRDLTAEEAAQAFDILMDGAATPAQIGSVRCAVMRWRSVLKFGLLVS